MKFLIMLIVPVLLLVNAQAEVSRLPNFPKAMSFIAGNSLQKPNLEFKYRFNEIARCAGLDLVFDPSSVGYGVAFQWVATLPKFEKTILSTYGRKVEFEFIEKIYKIESGYMYQLSIGEKQASLFFIGMNENDVKSTVSCYQKQYHASKVVSQSTRSMASELSPGEGTSASSVSSANKTSAIEATSVVSYAMGEVFKKCGVGVVEGANNFSKSILVDPIVTLWETAREPKKVWQNTVAQWDTLVNNLSNFQSFAKQVVKNFGSLPEAEKSRLYCSFVGAGGAGGLAVKGSKAILAAKTAVKLESTVSSFPEINQILKLRKSGVASTDPKIRALREKLKARVPENRTFMMDYVNNFYPDFPDDVLIAMVKNPKCCRFSGNEFHMEYPFPGAQSVTFYMGKNGNPSSMSVFLGWGPTNPARDTIIESARKMGLNLNLSEHFSDGFAGTSDPTKMMGFLKAHTIE